MTFSIQSLQTSDSSDMDTWTSIQNNRFLLVKDLLHFKVDVSRSLIGLLELNLLFRYSEVQVSLKDNTKDNDKTRQSSADSAFILLMI